MDGYYLWIANKLTLDGDPIPYPCWHGFYFSFYSHHSSYTGPKQSK